MKFERLRLCGFKSFVEPAEFIIEPGLTGVIGPNGCGKSNLLEAMRWVMGASSAKALRGAGMDDVIFAGAGKRPSRNWAEVTLVLNNSERTAPAQFNDTDVLEVTRRIDRDSGSTYRLNGREVRARDIQLLFADASTGANSPALVRQGQISELINAKPENRRRLLEEAAGITGLHSRRREAELRLKAAEGNLTRLDDVVGQLESQQAALKRQARQAVRYRSLSSDIRKTEALAAYLRWSDAQSDLEASERALSEADQAVADAARESATAAKHQAEAAGAAPPLRDREVEAAAALHRLVVARDAIDKEEERARKEAERLAAQLGELSQDVERESNLLQDAEKALSSLSDEEKRLAANSAGDGAAVEEAAKALSGKNETLDRAEGELDRLNTEAANLEAKRRSVLSARADVGKRLERLRRQAEDDRAELGDIAEKRTGQTEADEALRAQEAAAASLAAAEQAVVDLEARRGEVEASAQTRRAAAADADAALAELRAEVSALEKVLKAGGETASAPLLDALQVRPGFETALAAALGSDLSAPTDPAAAAHWRQATPTCAEGAPVLPDGVQSLAEMVDGPAFLQARLARIGVVDAPPTAEMLGALAPGVRLVSRNGDLWRWDGFVASARAKTPQAVRLEHQARLRELAAPLAQAEETASAAQTASKAAGEALSQLRGADGAARSEVRARREAANAAQKAAERLAAQSREIAGKIAALEEAGRRLETEIHEAEAEDRSAQTVLEGLPDGEALRTQLAAAREAVSQYRGEVAEARSRHATTAREADARRTRLKEIELERQVWRDRAETANKRLEALDIRRAETDNALKAARTSPERLETERASLVDQIDAAERRRARAADDLAAAETRLADADQTLKQTEKAVAAAREARARADALTESARERLEETVARAQETCGRAPEGLLELAEQDPEDDAFPAREALEKKLEKLKRDRDAMGGVNLRAEEEAEELDAQLTQIQEEQGDLLGAIDKLRRAISSLNKEGRERLLTAFETVNANFKELFVKLFNGGEAELRLTESDDPLEAGLEIFASPPGKKLASMTLMSGGEQALTATSLIFAVFMANPAPICVLDEVDAPLDDANVDRFCRLMDEMARRTETRFLCITHHAVTMSRMDRLFGVTMAERGVSQLVSVDLTAAERIAAAQ